MKDQQQSWLHVSMMTGHKTFSCKMFINGHFMTTSLLLAIYSLSRGFIPTELP